MEIDECFSLDLVTAVNRWMLSPSADVASLVDKAAANLPVEFRMREAPVFRRVALGKSSIWQLLGEQSLSEKISSWTLDSALAKAFDGGVPPVGWQGVIFKILPDRGRTVLNIYRLFSSGEFRAAVQKHRAQVPNIEYGIDEFSNSESEVIVELDYLRPEDVWSYGGYSASEAEIIEMAAAEMLGRAPTEDERNYLSTCLKASGAKLGAKWITEEQVKSLQIGLKDKIKYLQGLKRAQAAWRATD
ncbi:hypothetical protein [Pseudomonas sp. BJa3]|uniref:hypothetical protein n=1 Tax=Pseudomonas sp. BJa3 TaxID=2986525 RepID=UPI0022658E26|nr:hypothetical protein [Pseudomonas sp. BJa3]MCX5510436.1 hypothetical protein [Pseudomonas sp. BJa3]